MEHSTRTDRLLTALLSTALAVFGLTTSGTADARPVPEIIGADAPQTEVIEWALDRFETAGIGAPDITSITVHHDGTENCRGNQGYYTASTRTVDLCVTEVTAFFRHTVLHELAHGWDYQGVVAGDAREAFKRLRDVDHWAEYDEAPWYEQGSEQLAEIIAWGIDHTAPRFVRINDNGCADLLAAYRTLTGLDPANGITSCG